MPTKQVACDPCRFSKLACDHVRPICGRCRRKNQGSGCAYRLHPFKKRKINDTMESVDPEQPECLIQGPDAVERTEGDMAPRTYPNPGYLGSSSYTTIFDHLSPAINYPENNEFPHGSVEKSSSDHKSVTIDSQVLDGCNLIIEIERTVKFGACARLVRTWVGKGTNLALASTFTLHCANAVEAMFTYPDICKEDHRGWSEKLCNETVRQITLEKTLSREKFCRSFCSERVRWETIGLFFTAVSRATLDFHYFEDILVSSQQRQKLRNAAMRFSDRCLDICLSLDCLNDIQLILQYENFINHSFVDGDQSYGSWKKLGDVISSIYALGYHEQIQSANTCPEFLQHLREMAVAFTYSADKNVSIFLGRPPRILQKYCKFAFLSAPHRQTDNVGFNEHKYLGWNPNGSFEYTTEAWWSMLCAVLKEKVLEIPREKTKDERQRMILEIEAEAAQQWTLLPERYRFRGRLISAAPTPIERDFVASARLNHLHVLFFLLLSQSQRLTDHDDQLLSLSAEILHLVVEASLLKEHLANSGTGLIWKESIVYYGLPAAGVLCLALLDQSKSSRDSKRFSMLEVFQDLSVLVTEVETGGLIDPIDPNYALLSKATKTIQVILDRSFGTSIPKGNSEQPQNPTFSPPVVNDHQDDWIPWAIDENCDFEIEFWNHLLEHPNLIIEET